MAAYVVFVYQYRVYHMYMGVGVDCAAAQQYSRRVGKKKRVREEETCEG